MGACNNSPYCEYLSTNICCYECKNLGLHKGKIKKIFNGWNSEESNDKSECSMDTKNGQCRVFKSKFINTPEGKCDFVETYESVNMVKTSFALDKDNFNCPYYKDYTTFDTVIPANDIPPCKDCKEYIKAEKRECNSCWKSDRNKFGWIGGFLPVSHEDCWNCKADWIEENDTEGFNPSKWECKNYNLCKRCFEIGLKNK